MAQETPRIPNTQDARLLDIAERLAATEPDNRNLQGVVRSLKAGFEEAAVNYYRTNQDKMHSLSAAAKNIIEKELIGDAKMREFFPGRYKK